MSHILPRRGFRYSGNTENIGGGDEILSLGEGHLRKKGGKVPLVLEMGSPEKIIVL